MSRITPGKHTAVARSWEFGESSKGTDQVGVEFEIVEGLHAGEFITWYGFFTSETEERTIESLRAAGLRGDDVTAMVGVGDRRVQLVIEDDTYEGKTRSRVKWVNRTGGNGVQMKKSMDDAKKRQLAARLKAKLKATPELPPEPKPQGIEGRPAGLQSGHAVAPEFERTDDYRAPGGDDYIPF